LLVIAGDRILLETFRYWLLSFFNEAITVDTLLMGSPFSRNTYRVGIPLLFSHSDISRFHGVLEQHLIDVEEIVAVANSGLDPNSSHLAGYHVPWTCTDLAHCMETLAFALDLPCGLAKEVGAPPTPRERQILEKIATGASIKEISYDLGISVHTVAAHKRSLYLKTGVHTMQQLALYAVLHHLCC